MKKFILATLLATGFAAFTSTAEAGRYDRECRGHDRYGRPVYVYVPSRSYCEPRYRSYSYAPSYHRSYDYYRPSYRSHSYRSSARYYDSRPRFAISFGF